ncbi:MAG: HEAT repeat domain-containing protein [Actinomycetota bacterium]|nr:HEAT repeat domain-containing protein [Actinomycetota bacterium]
MSVERAAEIAAQGHAPLPPGAAAALSEVVATDPDPAVRAAAMGALARSAPTEAAPAWLVAAADPDPAVRLRAAEVAPALGAAVPETAALALLADPDAWVAEAGAFALGERAPTATAVAVLAAAAVDHADPLVREAAVAALGALGDEAGLPAILHACSDKPAVRRRAVLALAAFEGEAVEAKLRAALEDRDWQVRQAAEDLLRE